MGLFTRWKNKEELTSARMNKMLDEIEEQSGSGIEVVDNLISQESEKALSAKQGFKLNEKVISINNDITTINNKITSIEENLEVPKVLTPIPLQVNNGWIERTVKGTYAKDHERGILYLTGHYKKTSNYISTNDDVLAILPENYRPKETKIIEAIFINVQNGISAMGFVLITTNGQIRFKTYLIYSGQSLNLLNEIAFSGSILLN